MLYAAININDLGKETVGPKVDVHYLSPGAVRSRLDLLIYLPRDDYRVKMLKLRLQNSINF